MSAIAERNDTRCYSRIVLMVTGDGYSDLTPPGFLLSVQTANLRNKPRSARNDSSAAATTTAVAKDSSSNADNVCEEAIPLHEWKVKHNILFGCGEGTRRCLNEQHVKLKNLRAICLLNNHLDSASGIASTLFHMGDTGAKEVTVCGARGIEQTIEAVNETYGRKFPTVTTQSIDTFQWGKVIDLPLYSGTEKAKGSPAEAIDIECIRLNQSRQTTEDHSSDDLSSSSSESTSSSENDATEVKGEITGGNESSDSETSSSDGTGSSSDTDGMFIQSMLSHINEAKHTANNLAQKRQRSPHDWEPNKMRRIRETAGSHKVKPRYFCAKNANSSLHGDDLGLIYCIRLVRATGTVPIVLVIDITNTENYECTVLIRNSLGSFRKRCKHGLGIILFSSILLEAEQFESFDNALTQYFGDTTITIKRIGEKRSNGLDNDCYFFTFWKAAKLQAQLALLDRRLFPFRALQWLKKQKAPVRESAKSLHTLDTQEMWPSRHYFCQSTVHLSPEHYLENLGLHELTAESSHYSVTGTSKQHDLLEVISKTENTILTGSLESYQPESQQSVPCTARLYILGTGAATPGKYRSNTGIYICLDPNELDGLLKAGVKSQNAHPRGLLLDCGEGVLTGFSRLFQTDKHQRYSKALQAVLAGIQLIWISHHHTDHHSGLLSLLQARAQCAQENFYSTDLAVVCPSKVRRSLDLYRQSLSSVSNPLHNLAIVSAQDFNNPLEPNRQRLVSKGLFAATGQDECRSIAITSFLSIPVEHCAESYGVVMIIAEPATRKDIKIVFSGDTRPCQRLVAAGNGASLLIHEATFEDSKYSHAVKKKHSTVGEALGIAKKMGAFATVLTHFSQRYSKLGPSTNGNFDGNFPSCNAYDCMQFCLSTDTSSISSMCQRANSVETSLTELLEHLGESGS